MRQFTKAKYNNSEQVEKRFICDMATRRGAYVRMYPSFRGAGNGKVYSSRYMPRGVPDLVACWRMLSLWMEIKRPETARLGGKKQGKGKIRPEQKTELQEIDRAGGIGLVLYSVEEAVDVFNRLFTFERRLRELEAEIKLALEPWLLRTEGLVSEPEPLPKRLGSVAIRSNTPGQGIPPKEGKKSLKTRPRRIRKPTPSKG